MQRMDLNGTWSLRYCEPGEGERLGWPSSGVQGGHSIAARVPGDVHLDLVEAGIIGEPLYGRNALACRWIESKDWWYSREFDIPAGFIGDRVELHFAGLDTTADIWLNGHHVGRHNNMFVPCTLDVTPVVHQGRNRLVVRVDAGLRAAQGKEVQRYLGISSPSPLPRMWIRKAQFTFEWDWSPRLLTCGIWRGVELRSYRRAVLRDVYLRTYLLPDGSARVGVSLEVESLAQAPQEVRVQLSLSGHGEHITAFPATLLPGLQTLGAELNIPNPALWWPAPLGRPDLYDCSVVLEADDGAPLDRMGLRYGLRTIELRREPLADGEGESFTFVVNGQPVFCKGANWSPADCLLPRVTPARYRELVRLAAEAHFNMFRMNGVGIFEDPLFYDLCDEFGILIWQDFPYACSYYPDDDPTFVEEAQREAELAVRALRNHACLALWCGTNENLWHHFRACQAGRGAERCYGDLFYHRVLPEVCARLDPQHPYWPGSPWGGEDPNSQEAGNRHSWEVSILLPAAQERIDYSRYAQDRGKFISEFGILAPVAAESLAEFLPPEEFHRGSPSWVFHTNTIERDLNNVETALRTYWRPAEELTLSEYITYAQLIQAEGLKLAIEHWRRRKFATSGALFWNYADCWGATIGWTIVDYYLRRKTAYDFVRRAYAPILVSIEHHAGHLRFWLINDTLQPIAGRLEYGLVELPTSQTAGYSLTVQVPANGATPVAEMAVPHLAGQAGRWAAYARLVVDGKVVSSNRLFLAGMYFNQVEWPAARFSQHLEDGTLIIKADTFVWQAHIQAPAGVQAADNHLDLLPGEERRIPLHGPAKLFGQVQVRALNQAR